MTRRRTLPIAGALAALVALVAVASRAHAPTGGSTTHGVDSRLIWEFILVGVVGLFIVSVPFAVWVVMAMREGGIDSSKPRRSALWRVPIVGLLLLLALAVAAVRLHGHHGQGSKPPSAVAGAASSLKTRPPKPVPFDWLPAIVILSVAAVGAGALAVLLFRRPPRRAPTRAELAARLSAVLDDSLDDLLAERDPRRAVIAAYARLERTLAGAGLPRAAAEAPLEYLRRVLRDLLSTSGDAVSRLTSLFERAKFSPHEVDDGMKAEAIGALVAVRDELREAAS